VPRLREGGVPGIERIWLGIVKPVFPALLPDDIGCQRSFEFFPGHKALKTQTGGRVAHNQDPLPFPAERQIGEKSAHPVCRLAPTLTTGVRTIEVSGPITMHLGRSGAVELPVVTLSQSPVLENGYGRGSKGHLHRLDRSRQVRHEDGRQPVVAAPPAELHGIRASGVGEMAGKPPGGPSPLAVLGGCVRLVDNLDGHSALSRRRRMRFDAPGGVSQP
jgi:hypothetical protein